MNIADDDVRDGLEAVRKDREWPEFANQRTEPECRDVLGTHAAPQGSSTPEGPGPLMTAVSPFARKMIRVDTLPVNIR